MSTEINESNGGTPSSQLSCLICDALAHAGIALDAVFCELWILDYDLPRGVGLVRRPDEYWIHPSFAGAEGDPFCLYGHEPSGEGGDNDDDDDARTADMSRESSDDDDDAVTRAGGEEGTTENPIEGSPPASPPPMCPIGVGMAGTLFSESSPSRISWRQIPYMAIDPYILDREDGQLTKIREGGAADWVGGVDIKWRSKRGGRDVTGVLLLAFLPNSKLKELKSRENAAFLTEMAELIGDIRGHSLIAEASEEETYEWITQVDDFRRRLEWCYVPSAPEESDDGCDDDCFAGKLRSSFRNLRNSIFR